MPARLDLALAVLADLGDAQQTRVAVRRRALTTSPGSSASRLGGSVKLARSRAAQVSNSQVSAISRLASVEHERQVGLATRPLAPVEAARLGDRLLIVAARRR